MEHISGEAIYLRLLEITDLEPVLRIENNTAFWGISQTTSPFSKEMIFEYLMYAKRDIKEVQQLRLAICDNAAGAIVGLLDLFDYDAYNQRAGVGILIEKPKNRRKGYAAEALRLILQYAKEDIGLQLLYANILEDNQASIALFEKQAFERIGLKKQWRRVGEHFKNEFLYQHIL
jgi:diamine N-acetyltransferase